MTDEDRHRVTWRWRLPEGPGTLTIEAECKCGGFWLYPDDGMQSIVSKVAEHQGMTYQEAWDKLRYLVERDIWGPLVR
jgi:hypothetical protein